MNGKRAKALRRVAAQVTLDSDSGLMETHHMALPMKRGAAGPQIKVLGFSARAVYQGLKRDLAEDKTAEISAATR